MKNKLHTGSPTKTDSLKFGMTQRDMDFLLTGEWPVGWSSQDLPDEISKRILPSGIQVGVSADICDLFPNIRSSVRTLSGYQQFAEKETKKQSSSQDSGDSSRKDA